MSLEIYGEFAVGYDIARSLTYLGDATLMSGDLTAARKDYLDALQISIEEKTIPIALDALLGLSDVQARVGNTEHALVLCYHILCHPSSEEDTKSRAEQLRATLEPKLNPEEVMAARSMATEHTFEMIVKAAQETAFNFGDSFTAKNDPQF